MSVEVDQRSAPRRRVMKGVKIAYGDFVFVQDCIVRDLSDTGARIVANTINTLPNEFYLIFQSERTMRKVMVKWRHKNELGVVFEELAIGIMNNPDPRLRQFKYG